MNHVTVPICLVVALLCGGCVSQSKYDALQATLDKTRAKHADKVKQLDASIAALKKELAAKKATIAERDKTIAELKSEIAGLTEKGEAKDKALKELEGKLADVVKDRSRLRSSAAELKKALAELNKRKAEADALVKQFKDLLARFKSLIDAGKLKVKIADGRMVLELPTDVLFPSGKAKLSDAGMEAVKEVSQVLAGLPGKRRFQVEGHTDNVPIKTARYPSNWQLASARALNVVETMIEAGMPGQRISAAAYGEYRPVANNDTDEGKARNRRIEIVLVPDLSSLPGFSELQKAMGGK